MSLTFYGALRAELNVNQLSWHLFASTGDYEEKHCYGNIGNPGTSDSLSTISLPYHQCATTGPINYTVNFFLSLAPADWACKGQDTH